MSLNQYRITFDGDTRQPVTELTQGQWERIFDVCEERGLHATLETRLVVDGDADLFLACVANSDGTKPKGYMRIGERVICPWTVLAEADFAR